jgi:SAM-dependent methyltransferase
MHLASRIALAGLSLGLFPTASAQAPPAPAARRPDVIFVPTPQEVVDRMLELAEVKKGDVLYDLGCGDGRIVVTAARRYGVRAVGIDIDPKRVEDSRRNVLKGGVAELVTIKQGDIFQEDLGGASVVTLYLIPNLNARLRPRLARLRPGTRVVSHSFDMKGAKPKRVVKLRVGRDGVRTIFLWVVPFEEDGR